MDTTCRCGAPVDIEPHPCHGRAYACRKPAKRRLYNPQMVSLAGMQMKVQVWDTYACDECWALFAKKD